VLTLRDVGREDSTILGKGLLVVDPPNFALSSGDFVLFVHGFNVDQAAAQLGYARFRWWLEHYQVRARVLELHWPGDRQWGWFSALCYPTKVDVAIRGGELLAEWIASKPASRFTIVAHSLGCRVAVEAVAELRRTGHLAQVCALTLMAAAVPVQHIARRDLGPWKGEVSPHWQILYSRGDTVLRWTFGPGQFVAVDSGFPVGLHGAPLGHWTAPGGEAWELFQRGINDNSGSFYRHGHYWQGGPSSFEPASQPGARSLNPIHAPIRRNAGGSAEFFARACKARVPRRLPSHNLPPGQTLPDRDLQTPLRDLSQ